MPVVLAPAFVEIEGSELLPGPPRPVVPSEVAPSSSCVAFGVPSNLYCLDKYQCHSPLATSVLNVILSIRFFMPTARTVREHPRLCCSHWQHGLPVPSCTQSAPSSLLSHSEQGGIACAFCMTEQPGIWESIGKGFGKVSEEGECDQLQEITNGVGLPAVWTSLYTYAPPRRILSRLTSLGMIVASPRCSNQGRSTKGTFGRGQDLQRDLLCMIVGMKHTDTGTNEPQF